MYVIIWPVILTVEIEKGKTICSMRRRKWMRRTMMTTPDPVVVTMRN